MLFAFLDNLGVVDFPYCIFFKKYNAKFDRIAKFKKSKSLNLIKFYDKNIYLKIPMKKLVILIILNNNKKCF